MVFIISTILNSILVIIIFLNFNKLKDFFHLILREISFKNKQKAVLELLDLINLYDVDGLSGRPLKLIQINYKFFNNILAQFIGISRKYGIFPKKNILSLRRAVLRDFEFEKKLLKEIHNGIFQMIFMAALIWGLILVFKIYYPQGFTFSTFSVIATLHCLGLLWVIFPTLWRKKRRFSIYFPLFESLYQFQGLYLSGVPYQKTIEQSQVNQVLNNKRSGPLGLIPLRMEKMMKMWREKGMGIEEHIQEAIEELWSNLEGDYQAFQREFLIIRFIGLVIFYLLSYFIFLGRILSSLSMA